MRFQEITPTPGQESVWGYPRPPSVEDCPRRIRVVVNETVIADSTNSKRVLETSHPPVFYIPKEDVRMEYLAPSGQRYWCEWKGEAYYYSISMSDRQIEDAAWFYPAPTARFAAIKNCVAFYPSLMDACYVDEEKVTAQDGDFYGGWITSDIVGPFKGGPGTWLW